MTTQGSDLWEILAPRIKAISMEPRDMRAGYSTRGGGHASVSRGDVLWEGSVEFAGGNHADVAEIQSVVEQLCRPNTSFLMWDPRQDKVGAPDIAELIYLGEQERVKITSTASFDWRPGMTFSVGYGSPFRRSLHRVWRVQPDPSFSLDHLDIWPPLPRAVGDGDAVRVARPLMRAVVDPNSYQTSKGSDNHSGSVSFSFTQQLRPLP
jgi:hypothetical protein